jgi:hypothetical protein
MWLLSLPSWIQTAGAAFFCLALGFGGGFLKGYSTADARAKIAALQKSNADLIKASAQKDILLSDHARRVEQDTDENDRLTAELKRYLDARPEPSKPAACRFDASELRLLQQLADY